MAFRLGKDAKEWFKYIRPQMDYDFDIYYLCLMVGLKKNQDQKKDISQSDSTELTEDFPGDYRSKGRLIIGLFLLTEIKNLGINIGEREAINKNIRRYLDINSPSKLSNEGIKEMNKYSNGGFEALSEHFEERPRTLEAFLIQYKEYLDSL